MASINAEQARLSSAGGIAQAMLHNQVFLDKAFDDDRYGGFFEVRQTGKIDPGDRLPFPNQVEDDGLIDPSGSPMVESAEFV